MTNRKSREPRAPLPELSRPSRRSAPSAWRRTGGWLLPVLAATIIFAPPFAPTVEAQTVQVSNVGQTRSSSLALSSAAHEWAQAFTTGDNSAGYTVTSVGLDLSSVADPTINFAVGIWTNSNSNLPGSSLVTLTQPASLTLGVNEFTTPGIELAANTTYWVVVDSNGGGSAQWEGTASDSEDSTASGWSIADESYIRPSGDTWSSYTDPFKFRVAGTAKLVQPTNNAPSFTEGTDTMRSVAENTASGQNIGAPVTATDTDTGDTLTYTLGGTDAAAFGIVQSSGQLQTSAALDFETKDSYAVTVSVSDGNGGADSINVTINVTKVDEPNNAPSFTEGTDTMRSVAENTASGQNIGAPVTATDTDTGDTLTYTLGGTDAAAFGIVQSSGQLQTSAALDFETKDSYAVTVSVSDGNGGADSINVTINVTKVDEPNNAPSFTEGTDTMRSVAENTASGQNIGAPVTATDTDTGDTLTYTLGGHGRRRLRHRPVQRSAPDQRRARLRDERQLCGDGFGLRRQRRRGQHQRDHQRHEGGRAQQRAELHRGNRHHAERRREHGIGPEHRCPRHGDGYRHGRHADLHPGRDGRRRLRHRPVQRSAPDQRRARLRDERQLCGDGFGLRRQRRRGQHQRDHQRHEGGRAQQRAELHRGNRHHAERRREHGIGPEHRHPRHGDGCGHERHADLHPGRARTPPPSASSSPAVSSRPAPRSTSRRNPAMR